MLPRDSRYHLSLDRAQSVSLLETRAAATATSIAADRLIIVGSHD